MKRLAEPETKSPALAAENLARLKALFPEAATEGGLDLQTIGQLVGQAVAGEEKYGLNWSGKRAARQLALQASSATLRPRRGESVDWETTRNLMLEGENLEVLKLLQRRYAGRVKLIYIDPPYNTGGDFVYADNYRDTLRHYQQLMGWRSEGGEATSSAALRKNAGTSGRFHTAWLNMIYPRLKLARPLLTEDGAIFVSCDETEQPRLRLVMDELFGEENFVADIVWAAGRKNDSRLISVSHEYLVGYARDAGHLARQGIQWRQRKKGLDEIYARYERLRREHGTDYAAITAGMKRWFKSLPAGHPAKAHKHYCHADARGLYFPDNISWPGGGGPKYEVLHPRTGRPVTVPSRGWMTSDAEKMRQWIAEDRVHFGPDEAAVPCIKSYLQDREWQAPYSVFYQDGRAATKRLRQLMGGDCFDFPKDETVLQELVGMLTGGGEIVLDFFAGSGATGHAVMAQNAVDAGQRRFILVQLPEPLDPQRKEQRAAAALCDRLGRPRNIAELTKERLRRAGGKIRAAGGGAGDVGFRVFQLASSNLRSWIADREDLSQSLREAVEQVKPDRGEEDLLFELALNLGFDLAASVVRRTVAGKTVYNVDAGRLLACLAAEIAAADVEPLALGMAAWHRETAPGDPPRFVFRDSAFADDVAKAGMAAVLRRNGIEDIRSL